MGRKPKAGNKRGRKGAGCITKKGRKYYVKIVEKGKPTFYVAGEKLESARQLQKQIMREKLMSETEDIDALIEYHKKQITQLLIKKGIGNITLDELWDKYLNATKNKKTSESTLKQYKYTIDGLLKWLKANYPKIKMMSEITSDIAQEYTDNLFETNHGTTPNSKLKYIKTVFESVLGENHPFSKVEHSAAKQEFERRPITDDEWQILKDTLKSDLDMEILFYLGRYTGARIADCALMKWENIDFANNTLTFIPKKTQRSGKTVSFKIHPVLRELLERIPHTGEYLSESNAGAVKFNHISTQANNIFMKSGIKKEGDNNRLCFHSLRHTFASETLNAGAPIEVVREMLGHSKDSSITRKYFHADKSVMGEIIEKLK